MKRRVSSVTEGSAILEVSAPRIAYLLGEYVEYPMKLMYARTELVRTTRPSRFPSSFMSLIPSWTVLRQVRKFHSMHFQCSSADVSVNRPGTLPPAQAKMWSGEDDECALQAARTVSAAAAGSVRSHACA